MVIAFCSPAPTDSVADAADARVTARHAALAAATRRRQVKGLEVRPNRRRGAPRVRAVMAPRGAPAVMGPVAAPVVTAAVAALGAMSAVSDRMVRGKAATVRLSSHLFAQ